MIAIFTLAWRICTFQSGPEAMPYSVNLLTFMVIANAMVSIVVSALISSDNLLQTTTLVVINQAAAAVLVGGVLSLMGFGARVPQTLTAWFGCDLILTLISGAVFAAALTVSEQAGLLAVGLLGFWVVAIYGFIFQRATNMHIGFGIALAVFIALLSTAIGQTAIGA